ncbi:MAG: alpha-2-macroglobulin [Acidobacteria bacterium]|nr:alpha-2-macroglobulin [Acidobacteriota bacterium]MBI3654957.1 alpha-2-macroglobulin [Acidobacteriota bacterium]
MQKNLKLYVGLWVLALFNLLSSLIADSNPRIEIFTPQGTVKSVGQVAVRFSDPIVSFGDPRLTDPFSMDCIEKGRGRWADGKNWIYDFDRALPAGVECTFSLKPDIKTLSGQPISGEKTFTFSTGGPSITRSDPYQGSENIDEQQVFILTLDVEATEESVLQNVACEIDGIQERVEVRVVKGEVKKKILSAHSSRHAKKPQPTLLLQCKRAFPSNRVVRLIWGKGVMSKSRVATAADQVLPFKTRPAFTATFRCERENPKASCIPIRPMHLSFSAPVSWSQASKILLRGPGNKIYPVSKTKEGDSERAEDVTSVSFESPLPEKTTFTLELPKTFKDDAGRRLSNLSKFPLTVKTHTYPPLAKFAARFGIIELKGDATLPVTLRNIEPVVHTKVLKVGEESPADEENKSSAMATPAPPSDTAKRNINSMGSDIKARVHRVPRGNDEAISAWLRKLAMASRTESIFKGAPKVKESKLPKPGGARAFEVVGIPLKEPGFYVVEVESKILGISLLGATAPMYVPTGALVTNLSAHFKWGSESSLVWVTTLDKAEPVKTASVTIRDCTQKVIWSGKTDDQGIAHIKKHIPSESELPRCQYQVDGSNYEDVYGSRLGEMQGGLFITASAGEDMTFVHSGWNKGIESWRYKLPSKYGRNSILVHTIFDRTLFRAGETVHMKHLLRRHTMSGFAIVNEAQRPAKMVISHLGTDQRYEFDLNWDLSGIADTTWQIPKEAKLGQYKVVMSRARKQTTKPEAGAAESEPDEANQRWRTWTTGTFRVEEFRIPLMRGIIQPPKDPLVNPAAVEVDVHLSYLSGGGAGGAPVKLRSQVLPRSVTLQEYSDFTLVNGAVKEETTRGTNSDYDYVDEAETEEQALQPAETQPTKKRQATTQTLELQLDRAGAARAKLAKLPKSPRAQDLVTELEFKDPNGETQTVSRTIPLWPAKVLAGIKPDAWSSSQESFRFQAVVLDLVGKPQPGALVKVDLFQRKYYSHRKRLVGGFYSYEHITEVKRVGNVCEGTTDPKGLLICDTKSPVSGNVILQAQTTDDVGNISTAHRDVWISGKDDWWFDVSDNDRIDLLPERKRYEAGEAAKFQVRMPFREATVLVTVEREGIMEAFVTRLSGKTPTIEIPVKPNFAPNVFVSALCVRGRVGDIKPTALVDLGKPAYKLGIAEINVGWQPHELQVTVLTDKKTFKIREKVLVKINVKGPNNERPPQGSEVAVAAIDEGLLELMPNNSWKLLEAMMSQRGYEVSTATAQMQVVGKRHYGLKALAHGGGGGRQITRELFDTLLLWRARLPLNGNGEATLEIPLNDSLTSFRIVAIAHGGAGLFGAGHTVINTTQDLMLLSGLPPLVRENDDLHLVFTIRNTTHQSMDVETRATVKKEPIQAGASTSALRPEPLQPQSTVLAAGEAKEIAWRLKVPNNINTLHWEVAAQEKGGEAKDIIRVKQQVVAAIPVRTFQATILQLDKTLSLDVEKPGDALPGKGGIQVSLKSKISEGLDPLLDYMRSYPYTCMEQKVSRAIALRDRSLWETAVAQMPSHLDGNGLVKYFPSMLSGSDILTAYILSISHEAQWEIPHLVQELMEAGLKGFIEGRIIRYSALPTADLAIRKMAALEALSRNGQVEPGMLSSISIEPNLWPTSAVIDWLNVLIRVPAISQRESRLKEAEQIIRARLNFQGTTMGFSTEASDHLWWLMISADVNAVRAILTFLDLNLWTQDMPRLVQGALARQHKGVWNTTTANAWGVLALEKFSKKFESIPVSGASSARLGPSTKSIDWEQTSPERSILLAWPKEKSPVVVDHQGTGKPWVTLQSLAAIPLKAPFSSGYKINKSIIPLEQKQKGKWSRGDVLRIKLDLEAKADMTWVVVNDPIPSGVTILGSGLGRDSRILTRGETKTGWVWPVFEERSFEAFRAYYEFVPKGVWSVEYTIRLNSEGTFHLPTTRVEALYASEMFGENPNRDVMVGP